MKTIILKIENVPDERAEILANGIKKDFDVLLKGRPMHHDVEIKDSSDKIETLLQDVHKLITGKMCSNCKEIIKEHGYPCGYLDPKDTPCVLFLLNQQIEELIGPSKQ